MKKILLTLFVPGAMFSAYGQVDAPQMMAKEVATGKASQQSMNILPKALGDTLWENNFDDPSDWVIDNAGQTAPATGWAIHSSVTGWPQFLQPGINSASGGNFAELGNGTDPNAVSATDVIYTMTLAAPIDFNAIGADEFVNLEFLQFGARFNDAQRVQISTDGTNFITVGDNSDKEVLSSTGGSEYANPDLKRINLSSFLGSAPANLWIRFQWTSAFPTNMTNGAWITYGWLIDDVKITTLPDNDISTANQFFGTDGLTYYRIPEPQIAPITGSVRAYNNGTNLQYNVGLEATESSAGYTAVSNLFDIPFGDSADLTLTTPFTPSGVGSYTLNYSILNDSIDDDPANNVLSSYSFTVGGDVYARDMGGTPQGAYSVGEPLEGGNLFDIFSNQALTGIDVRFGNTLDQGVDVNGVIYEVTPDDFEFIAETQTWTAGANDAGSEQTLVFSNPVQLEAGKTYLATVASSFDQFSIATSGSSQPQTTYLFGDLGSAGIAWYWAPSTVWVRMNFDPTLSTAEEMQIDMKVTLYPNPASEYTTLEFELQNAATVAVEVADVTGKVVYNETLANLAEGKQSVNINTQPLAEGVYFVNLRNGNNVVSKKLVIK